MNVRLNVEPAPRTAYEAAGRLVEALEHVHFVSDGETSCYSGHCSPDLMVPGPIGAARYW